MSDGRTQALLFVYYSGHADATALHLGASSLELRQLEALVAGSAATFRLLVLDACRSGALTRVKGGSAAPSVVLRIEAPLEAEGMVYLTSSAATEDSQESDELRGSFFTHYLVSGLLGAADANGDGRITLMEAYRHAYEDTLRASSATLAGPQHPTFQYDLRGRGDLVLTVPHDPARGRGVLVFPPGKAYLVFARGGGAVVGEVGRYDATRRISVKRGRYFVRGRGNDFLLEGELEVAAGKELVVADGALRRVELARLVRKGLGPRAFVHGPQVGVRMRSPLWPSATACTGPVVGYPIEGRRASVVPRVGVCRGSRDLPHLHDQMDELDAELRLVHAWDLRYVTLEASATGGVGLLSRTFTTTGVAPDRLSVAGHVAVGVGASTDLPARLYLALDLDAQTYLFRQRSSADGTIATATVFALRGAVLLGRRF